MLKWLKVLIAVGVLGSLLLTAIVYGVLSLSLPALDGRGYSNALEAPTKLSRDTLGHAVISAQNRTDAAFVMGYAHGQDRFFQMDLLRRNAAGELSELFGEAAIPLDKSMRFHQFRQRSEQIVAAMTPQERQLLETYAQGVNEGRIQSGMPSFEYVLLSADAKPWQPADSLLVIYSMYLDLQSATFRRDKTLIHIAALYGQDMVNFILQPSRFQAALDGSQLNRPALNIPTLPAVDKLGAVQHIEPEPLYGSNNWAVTGDLTHSGAAMVSDDMHLGLNVPSIWYRAQLNYRSQSGEAVQVTGVSLPGVPAIVVGSNDHIAWGFTNGYLDTADWVELTVNDKVAPVTETIQLPNEQTHHYELLISEFGPVKSFNGKQYALQWVAHQPYAVNLNLLKFETSHSVEQALSVASNIGIPVQNLMVVDRQGNAAWQPTGALPARVFPNDLAVPSSRAEEAHWKVNEIQRPYVLNPTSGKLWTANARVMSALDHRRFGDGGYALGARAQQIRDRLLAQQQFTEADFNTLQLDNEALFLKPWHGLLTRTLNAAQSRGEDHKQALAYLQDWQACACSESVGYTLVRAFRSQVIDIVFAQVEQRLKSHDETLRHLTRYFEPALWQLLDQQPRSWLGDHASWPELLVQAHVLSKQSLRAQYGPQMANWQWGVVNALTVQHPFSKQMPILSRFLDMPTVPGFGDKFMPAVQGREFGASQRFIAQPGHLNNAVMTVAGGQSGHPLSPYYRSGFKAYAEGKLTPLLPSDVAHTIELLPRQIK
ncbi:penicillin acylase family protein [Pseudoalteromonas sp. SMS1]|uniref:penicillin acylase family protein n=1 Tax=Pseudoalteromonas sp. SMS1 TaxID=2908894 RepID=UPI001F257206|nr:penicillin acylase family protein [Pseudoalteromonas sp. SMS1]MCF2858552.1 penicillin acylase family protein [Pseudoalteromonas sp. SMS1]